MLAVSTEQFFDVAVKGAIPFGLLCGRTAVRQLRPNTPVQQQCRHHSNIRTAASSLSLCHNANLVCIVTQFVDDWVPLQVN